MLKEAIREIDLWGPTFTKTQQEALRNILDRLMDGFDEHVANIVHSRIGEHLTAHMVNAHKPLPKFDIVGALAELPMTTCYPQRRAFMCYHYGAEPETPELKVAVGDRVRVGITAPAQWMGARGTIYSIFRGRDDDDRAIVLIGDAYIILMLRSLTKLED